MHGVGVGGGMHRDGGDAELLAGAQHAQRDLAAIGDEDLVEHRSACVAPEAHSMITQRLAELDRLAVLDQDLRDRAGARRRRIWFIVFIASMISSVSPGLHLGADFDERLGARLGRPIGGADHRRGHARRDALRGRLRAAAGGNRHCGQRRRLHARPSAPRPRC